MSFQALEPTQAVLSVPAQTIQLNLEAALSVPVLEVRDRLHSFPLHCTGSACAGRTTNIHSTISFQRTMAAIFLCSSPHPSRVYHVFEYLSPDGAA